jgi:hypothetical protein
MKSNTATKAPPTFGEIRKKKCKKLFDEAIEELARILNAHETKSIMIDHDDSPIVRGLMDNENVAVNQVYLDKEGRVCITTEDGGGLLGEGDYYVEDVYSVLIAVEKEIAPK